MTETGFFHCCPVIEQQVIGTDRKFCLNNENPLYSKGGRTLE